MTDTAAQDFQTKDATHQLSHQIAMLGRLGLGDGWGGAHRYRGSGAFVANDFITAWIAGGKHPVIGQLMKLGGLRK